MPYPNDRRKHRPEGDEVLSPEYLAMLIARGGEVKVPERDSSQRPQEQRYGRRKDDLPLPAPERRRAED